MLDVTKPVQWQGRAAEVLKVLKDGRIAALVIDAYGKETVCIFGQLGSYYHSTGLVDDKALTNVPERTVRWVNTFSVFGAGWLWETREEADRKASAVSDGPRSGLLKLTFEDGKLIAADVVQS